MFKLIQCAENTYYLECYCNTGVYHLGNGEVILIDSCDHKKSVKDLDKALEERGWRVRTIINTHCHVDHIMGNKFFKEKYGCKIYSSRVQSALTEEPAVELNFYFNGIFPRFNNEAFFEMIKAPCEIFSDDVLPEGFETMLLQGHCIDHLAVKTPDDVWFVGDCVLAEETFNSYKIPFFGNINKSIETAELLPSLLKGKLFVPSHSRPCEDIAPLAKINAERLSSLKDYFYNICENKSLEEILAFADGDLELHLNEDKFAKIGHTVRAIMQALIEDGKIAARLEESRLVYKKL